MWHEGVHIKNDAPVQQIVSETAEQKKHIQWKGFSFDHSNSTTVCASLYLKSSRCIAITTQYYNKYILRRIFKAADIKKCKQVYTIDKFRKFHSHDKSC